MWRGVWCVQNDGLDLARNFTRCRVCDDFQVSVPDGGQQPGLHAGLQACMHARGVERSSTITVTMLLYTMARMCGSVMTDAEGHHRR